MIHLWRILLILYIGGNVIYASAFVGEMPDLSEPYQWDLPWVLLSFLGVSAYLGYLCGRSEE